MVAPAASTRACPPLPRAVADAGSILMGTTLEMCLKEGGKRREGGGYLLGPFPLCVEGLQSALQTVSPSHPSRAESAQGAGAAWYSPCSASRSRRPQSLSLSHSWGTTTRGQGK